MNTMSILYLLAAIDIVLIAIITFAIFALPENTVCSMNDKDCISMVIEFRETCKPSTSIITVGNSTNLITLKITIYREGVNCIIKEEVIEDYNSGMATYDITGYNTTCELTPEELEKYGPNACQGSISNFVSPPDSDGGEGFAGGTPQSEPHKIYCSMYDEPCKNLALGYIRNCEYSELEIDEDLGQIEDVTSFWTLYINVVETSGQCRVFYKIINAVNLPPELPPHVEGMNMTCNIPLTEFPILGVAVYWCNGDLTDYIDVVPH